MIKTVNLTGIEQKVSSLGGFNTVVHNLGTESIFASKYPNISAGTDNVAEIPAGAAKLISTTNGTIFLLGKGKVEVTGQDSDGVNFRQPSLTNVIGGEENGINNYVDTKIAEVRAEIPASLPANGGNADTVNNHTVKSDVPENAKFTDTTYLNATTAADGLMSAADKAKLDGIDTDANNYSLPPASDTVRGGVKTGYSANGKNYPVQLSDEAMFVNVPWENTTYLNATNTAAGLMSEEDKAKLDGIDMSAIDTSTKMNKVNPTGTGSFSLNRKSDTEIGNYSFTEGYSSTASGGQSHAEGFKTIASSFQSHAEGNETTASGNNSHAEGSGTTASGTQSHAEGYKTTASSYQSHTEGRETNASGENSHAEGSRTSASNYASHAGGKCNKAMTDGGLLGNKLGDVFVIGNGTSETAPGNAFRITYAGDVYGIKAYTSSGADYAEFIKPWFDDNPNGEDRVGYFVTIKDGKLCFAEPNDYIVGITSGNPSVVGNGDEDWLGRWERDEFNRIIWEDVEETEEIVDEETGEINYEPTGKITPKARFKANPEYDPSQKYIERKDRVEWDYVGMIGVLPLRDDGSCVAGGFAKCGESGIATAADEYDCHKTFFVIERISDNVISVEMR